MAIFILVLDCSVPGGEVIIHKVEEVKFKEFYDSDLSAYVDGEFDNDKNWMQVSDATKFLVDRNFSLKTEPIGEVLSATTTEEEPRTEDQGLKTYVVDFEFAGDVEVQARDEEEARMKASEVPIDRLIFQNTHYGEQYVDEVKQ